MEVYEVIPANRVAKLLAKFRFLRGTKLDPFGYFAEHKMERGLIINGPSASSIG